MGWWHTHGASRQQIIDELRAPYLKEDARLKIIAEACTDFGRKWWVVFEHGDETLTPRRFVCLFMLRPGTKDWPGWGYKDVDESMGPAEVGCPVRLLDMAGPDEAQQGYALEWRQRVRVHAELQRMRPVIKATDTVWLRDGREFVVIDPRYRQRGRNWYLCREKATGNHYILKRSQMVRFNPNAPVFVSKEAIA